MTRTLLLAAAAVAALGGAAAAQEDYLGEVKLFGFNFCPRNTLPAAGQLLSISDNTALFSLYGTTYGGNGTSTFALPDLRGRSPVSAGQGAGLSNIPLGATFGAEQVTLNVNQMPAHNHGVTAQLNGVTTPGSSPTPAGGMSATSTSASIYGTGAPTAMSPQAIAVGQQTVGGGQPVAIRSPELAMTYCVVTQGIYPSRN